MHNIGDCAICTGMDPILWQQTGALVEEALADETACARLVSSLPMAGLLTVESRSARLVVGGAAGHASLRCTRGRRPVGHLRRANEGGAGRDAGLLEATPCL